MFNFHPKQREFFDRKVDRLWVGGHPKAIIEIERNNMGRIVLDDNANSEFKVHITDGSLEIEAEGLHIREHEGIQLSDGYHTMDELYNHRYALFCALVKIYDNYVTPLGSRIRCWKSHYHADGTMFEDSFIAGMEVMQFDGTKEQITYHLPMDWWDKFKVIHLIIAPEYDGHTSEDVIERLMKL